MLKLYNTLSRKKEVFKPIKKGKAGIYSCGPTVYNYVHIGNLRAILFYDLLKRYLKIKGFKIKHVMNITDVDDKTIKGSQKEKKSLKEFTKFYTKAFLEDIKKLNVELPDVMPKATEEIDGMVKLIKKLLDKEYAYKTENGDIYFSISGFKDYGKLANLDKQQLKEGASGRVDTDEYDKENIHDFALWKAWNEKDGEVFWKTDIGKGRPGWHIECSVMSSKYLGQPFDIHMGGIDLVFPHHTNEIAQSEAAYGNKFCNYWVHNDHLVVDGKKMSKSLGNFYTLRDLISKDYDPVAIRYLLLSTHYRQKLNFTFDGLKSAKNAVEKLNNFIFVLRGMSCKEDVGNIDELINEARAAFELKMDDDLNISGALGVMFDFMSDINKLRLSCADAAKVIDFMKDIDKVLGVIDFKEDKIPASVKKLVDEREKARKKKDFAKSDEIRDELKKKGYVVEDSSEGPRVRKI